MKQNKLIFTGHFDIGEKLTDSSRGLVQIASKFQEKKIVLIGDIGVEDKLYAFIRKGLEGIILTYHLRHHCAETACVLAQLPKTEKEIIETIDLNQYEEMVQNLRTKFPEILDGIKRNDEQSLIQLKQIGNDFLINGLIKDRLKLYGLKEDETILVKEKTLRNRVGRRVKQNDGKSWTSLPAFVHDERGIKIHEEIILNSNQKPVCRGIMFAFNELVSERGFTEIDYFIEERHRSLITKGWELFDACRKDLGHLNSSLNRANFFTETSLKEITAK